MEPYITTYTGRKICPLNIKPEDIILEDIIISGSNICRFGGHLQDIYSINEHQLLCLDIARSISDDEDLHFTALTHDICEIYSPVGDCLKPCKDAFFVTINNEILSINEYEDYIQEIIIRSITGKSFDYKNCELKKIDKTAVNTESLNLRGFSLNDKIPIFEKFSKKTTEEVRFLYKKELMYFVTKLKKGLFLAPEKVDEVFASY